MARKISYILMLLVCALAACQTSEKPGSAFTDGEELPLRLDTGDAEESSIPAFLWSPSRRRSTAGYHYMVAESLAMAGRYKDAHPLFESAYNLDPNPFLAGKLISAEANTGQLENALPQARKMVLLYPQTADLRFLYGQLLARRGMFKEAEAEIERAIDLDKSSAEYYLELINIHQAAGDLTKAVVIAEALVEAIPANASGWNRLAKLYLATGQKKRALEPARKAYDMQTSNPEVVLIYALALEMNDQSKTALGLYEQLYRINPTNEELIARMIELYRTLGDLEESLELLTEISTLTEGKRPGVELQRAIILWELKRFDEAAALLDKLAIANPNQDRLQYMAGLGQERLKKFDSALAYFTAISQNSQFYTHAQYRIAIIYKEQDKYGEALNVALKLEQMAGIEWDIYLLISGLYGDQKNYDEAVEALERGYERHDDKHRLLFMQGVYLERAGKIDECVTVMRRVIDVEPTNSSAFNYLGYLFAERGENLDEAESLIRRALELKPGDGYYLDSLAWVYYQRGDYKNALLYLEQAIAAVPGEGVVLEHFGDVYKKLGDQAKALDFYRKASKSNVEERDMTRIKQKLRDMEASES